MKVQLAELVRRHLLDEPLHHFLAAEVARDIDMNTTMLEARRVFDEHMGEANGIADTSGQERHHRLNAMECTGRVVPEDLDAERVDVEPIAASDAVGRVLANELRWIHDRCERHCAGIGRHRRAELLQSVPQHLQASRRNLYVLLDVQAGRDIEVLRPLALQDDGRWNHRAVQLFRRQPRQLEVCVVTSPSRGKNIVVLQRALAVVVGDGHGVRRAVVRIGIGDDATLGVTGADIVARHEVRLIKSPVFGDEVDGLGLTCGEAREVVGGPQRVQVTIDVRDGELWAVDRENTPNAVEVDGPVAGEQIVALVR